MFIQINTADYHNQFVCFKLTDPAGTLLHVGVAKMDELSMLAGVDLPPAAVCYLTIMHASVDPLAAANHARRIATEADRVDLRTAVEKWVLRRQQGKRQVKCNETGELFDSVPAVCRKYGMSPPNLYNHLRSPDLFKTVKQKTFKYVF